jgi:prophage antirepressor-like protein
LNTAPWFVAADLEKALDLKNIHMQISRLDPVDVRVTSSYLIGSRRDMTTVSEPGFYELVLGSRKRGAVAFKRWVCSEVLPSLRKYGRYEMLADESGNPAEDIPEVMVEMVRTIPFVDTEKERRIHIWEWLEERGMDDLQRQHRAVLGKIARRFLHTNNLPVLSRFGGLRKANHWAEEKGGRVYPPQILEMAYQEFLKGMKD